MYTDPRRCLLLVCMPDSAVGWDLVPPAQRIDSIHCHKRSPGCCSQVTKVAQPVRKQANPTTAMTFILGLLRTIGALLRVSSMRTPYLILFQKCLRGLVDGRSMRTLWVASG